MKPNTLKADEQTVKEILNFSVNHDGSESEIDARCYWILSLVGGLLLSGIWLGSLFIH
jgi:hypothetical protein